MTAHANRGILCAALVASAAVLAVAATAPRHASAAQDPQTQRFALSNGASIELSDDWLARGSVATPPAAPLASSVHPLSIYEMQAFENSADNSALLLAVSNNPFLGRDPDGLAADMRNASPAGPGLISYLSYFFFPPPPGCLPDSKTACQFSPTLYDFYSFLLTGGTLPRHSQDHPADFTAPHGFYLVPMEQYEFNGLTLFVFEAQDQQQIGLRITNHFNFPDSMQGSQGDFFWTIAASSPFPFVRDVSRRPVPVIHLVYAGVTPGPNSKPAFMHILHTLHPPRPN
jgi:hypothetical protein